MNSETTESGNSKKAARPKSYWLRLLGFFVVLIVATLAYPIFEKIVAMMAMDTIGYYSDIKGSQHYPFGLGTVYPDQANFIAFVSNLQNKALVRDVLGNFRRNTTFPALGLAIPEIVPGVGWSDHRFFWACDFPALLVTDTALFRDPFYHTSGDKADTVDYVRLAQVVDGLAGCVRDIADR
jgi:Peptidase family M28.